MRIASLTTMTAVALMAFTPAFAAGKTTGSTTSPSSSTQMENNTGSRMDTTRPMDQDSATATKGESNSWTSKQTGDQASAQSDNMETVQVAILGTTGQPQYKSIRQANTAEGIIGKDITDANGDTVGSVEDIIIDSGGNAQNVVVSHGGFLGMGADKIALPYDQVVMRGTEGDALSNVPKSALKQGRPFTYDESSTDTNAMTMASTNVSVDKILGAEVQSPQGEKVATAENVHFKNGKAEHVLLSPTDNADQKADQIAIAFADMQLIRDDDTYRFELTSNQMDNLTKYQEQAGAGGSTGNTGSSSKDSTSQDRTMMDETSGSTSEEY